MISTSIIVSKKPREPQIDEGTYDAIVTDVVESNGIATQFGLKDKIVVTFKVGDAEIKRSYNKSLHPSSILYGLIKELIGKAPVNEFDVETLKGMACRITVVHRTTDTSDVWANVDRVVKATRSDANPDSS